MSTGGRCLPDLFHHHEPVLVQQLFELRLLSSRDPLPSGPNEPHNWGHIPNAIVPSATRTLCFVGSLEMLYTYVYIYTYIYMCLYMGLWNQSLRINGYGSQWQAQ